MGLQMYSLFVRAHRLEEPSPHLPTPMRGGRTPPKWGRLTVLLLCGCCCCLRLLGNFRRIETHRFFDPPLLLLLYYYYWWCNVVFIGTNQCAPFHMFSCTAVVRSFCVCVCVDTLGPTQELFSEHIHFFFTVCFYHFSANCERHCCCRVAGKTWCMQIIS